MAGDELKKSTFVLCYLLLWGLGPKASQPLLIVDRPFEAGTYRGTVKTWYFGSMATYIYIVMFSLFGGLCQSQGDFTL